MKNEITKEQTIRYTKYLWLGATIMLIVMTLAKPTVSHSCDMSETLTTCNSMSLEDEILKNKQKMALAYMLKVVGNPYVYGATRTRYATDKRFINLLFKPTGKESYDCSSLPYHGYMLFVKIPPNTSAIKKYYRKYFTTIRWAHRRAGDLIVMRHAHLRVVVSKTVTIHAKGKNWGVVLDTNPPRNKVWKVLRPRLTNDFKI